MLNIAAKMILGVITGKLRIKTIKNLLRSTNNGGAISKVCAGYPGTPNGFDAWADKAEAAWTACGSMAETVHALVFLYPATALGFIVKHLKIWL